MVTYQEDPGRAMVYVQQSKRPLLLVTYQDPDRAVVYMQQSKRPLLLVTYQEDPGRAVV